jgi:hypothetical protein
VDIYLQLSVSSSAWQIQAIASDIAHDPGHTVHRFDDLHGQSLSHPF